MKLKHIPLFTLLMICQPLSAAHLSDSGEGEVLVFPYYTVNNDLATLIKINNNRDEAKAIKVNFLEGNNMEMTLSYNVYLGPHDSWEVALVATTATINGVIGEPSVLHVTPDTSCAPYLNKAGQEFLPFGLSNFPSDSAIMDRVTQGMVQVFEMGELPQDVAAWVDYTNSGVPANCGAFVSEWNDGEWNATELTPATGGLSGTASIIGVSEGSSITYNADAINNFYPPTTVIHTEPGNFLPNLNSAAPHSVVYSDGQIYESNWETGADAISALFMSQSISNDFILGSFIAAKTEWVVSFPTKGFYVNDQAPKAPFQSVYQEAEGACVNFGRIRNFPTSFGGGYGAVIGDNNNGQVCTPPPRPEIKTMCWAANVMFFYNCEPGNTKEEGAQILGAYNNQYGIRVKPYETGKSTIDFSTMVDYASTALKDADEQYTYHGFPVTGFAISKFTNSGAQPGLLAQYANVRKHNLGKHIVEEASE
ncbi:hypothetical protein [Marinicella meishanensis]|uniref:hypothetical protein n=1 Tax=Marinicella meishanensis TaxID=2873263 RepID=UPI001CBD881D|nr:hypothetical protein [Marinicella sp. NBU2979]